MCGGGGGGGGREVVSVSARGKWRRRDGNREKGERKRERRRREKEEIDRESERKKRERERKEREKRKLNRWKRTLTNTKTEDCGIEESKTHRKEFKDKKLTSVYNTTTDPTHSHRPGKQGNKSITTHTPQT